MNRTEKQRLTRITRTAVERIASRHPLIKTHAERAAAKFTPTNAEQFRKLSEIVWWLIAVDANADAMGVLDALCEVNDRYYWMFHALASSFATRAWLHFKQKNAAAARDDAKAALQWLRRDPNPKAITKEEVRKSIKRFDDWLDRADKEKGTLRALHVLSHAMRVLVMYQQFGKAGDAAVKSFPSREFTVRQNSGLKKLCHRLDT